MLVPYLLLASGFLVASQASRISLIALPSKSPQNGSRLHLICQLHELSKFNIIWKRINQNVGENCLPFKNLNASLYNCSHNESITEWILDPVTYNTRGLWSCTHGKEIASIHIDVNVPQRLDSLKLELPSSSDIHVASGTTSNALIGERFSLGTGTRSDPLNLIHGKYFGIGNFVLECSSSCASDTRQLLWTSLNSTAYGKYPLLRMSHEERTDCPHNLSSSKTRALITCTTGHQQSSTWDSESPVSINSKISLVGLNIVFCSTERFARIPDFRSYYCSNGFFNENYTTACAYVLCDGPQPPVLTSGEQTAIVISAFTLVFIITIICICTWRSRKSDKMTRINQCNGVLHTYNNQEAQMELML